jgi:RHS repeat-associated protein
VSTSYSYNPLNRLTSMQSTCATGTGCAAPNTIISSYAYTLGPTGNRLSVAELSGRSVTYGYDDLYRLTSETVASDPRGNNGQVSYTFDNVGNRLQRNSTLPAIVPTGLLSYDANDRVSTDTFDSNGNTTINSGQTNVYDFENRLVQRGGVTVVYDGDGNRVKETVATVTTSYLVADQNPTGYTQVLDELQGGGVTRTYSYGLELINERQNISGTLTTGFYGFDGHGSVRFLTSSTGAVTDTYDYDAFGNLISSTGSTPNNYLFAGEQFDPALGIYYNRARYYDQRQGTFWTMDTFEGDLEAPASLHKYIYASADPLNRLDPSGNDDLASLAEGESISEELDVNVAQQATKVGNNAQKIARALQKAREIGKDGEEAVEDFLELEKNTERIPSATKVVKFRIPDFLDLNNGLLAEVKNVAYQALTSQIRDLVAYAAANGVTLYLFVNESTEFSGPLQELIDEGVIKLVAIP